MGSVTYLLEVYAMERHVYKFEFKYDRQVNGKKTEFTVPVIVHNECYADACTKVNEFVQKNFADRVTEESTIKYVGEFVHGVLKPFVEEVKEEEYMLIGKSKKELVNLNKGLMIDVDVQKNEIKTLKQRCETNQQKIESLQKQVDGFKAKANYMSGFTFVQGSRGSGKTNFETELFKQRFNDSFLESKTADVIQEMIKKIENTQPTIIDVASMYPQEVDICKVYRIERDQALKENEALKNRVKYLIERNNRFEVNEKYYDEEYRKLSDEKQTHEMVINGYKKELSQLNLLMDDMEDRLEKQVIAREGMLKQLREYKAEKKRMNKIIDALTEDK